MNYYLNDQNLHQFTKHQYVIYYSNFDRDHIHISVWVYMLQKFGINSLPYCEILDFS